MPSISYLIGKINFYTNRIFKRNSIYRSYLLKKYENSIWWGLGVFVLRGDSVKLDLVDKASNFIKDSGFEIVDIKILNDEEQLRMSLNTRGSDWNGGLPAAFFVLFDSNPQRVPPDLVNQYPEMDNHRLTVKIKCREFLNSKVPKNLRSNFVHATDNSFKAWKYIECISQSYVLKIKLNIKNLQNDKL